MLDRLWYVDEGNFWTCTLDVASDGLLHYGDTLMIGPSESFERAMQCVPRTLDGAKGHVSQKRN